MTFSMFTIRESFRYINERKMIYLVIETYIEQNIEMLNQKMLACLLRLHHCNVSMLEILLEEIDQMP
jgi:hypothetical protein